MTDATPTMRVIWKFALGPVPHALPAVGSVLIPLGARAIHVGLQDGELCLWAFVEPDATKVRRGYGIYGTGQFVPGHMGYCGTVLASDSWVLHVFLSQ